MTEASLQEKWLQDYATRVANHIAQYRKYLKISAEDLSKLTEEVGYKIPRSSIANIENHKKKTITSHELSIIAGAFGVPPEGLIWNVLKPAEMFSYTPTSRQLPGYMVLSEANKNGLIKFRESNLTNAIDYISLVNLEYSQALSKKYAARTYYRSAAKVAEQLGHLALAQEINNAAKNKEITAAAQLNNQSMRVSHLERVGVTPWAPSQHIFWADTVDLEFRLKFSNYIESDSWALDSPSAQELMQQVGVQPVNEVKLISAEQIPSEPVYEVTEQDKVRNFPNYHGE